MFTLTLGSRGELVPSMVHEPDHRGNLRLLRGRISPLPVFGFFAAFSGFYNPVIRFPYELASFPLLRDHDATRCGFCAMGRKGD